VVVDFEHFGYEVIKKGGEVLRYHLMSGTEEARAALASISSWRWRSTVGDVWSSGSIGSKEEDWASLMQGKTWKIWSGPVGLK
jgi:hypothetical protein